MARCRNCGYAASKAMRYCPRCGAPLRDSAKRQAGSGRPPMTLLPLEERETEVCQIECWHGYFKCDFVAIAAGTNREIARSRLFRWRHSEPPPRDDAPLAAYRDLVGQLEALGWEPVGDANPWYAQRFRLVQSAGERTADKEPDAGPEDRGEDEEPERGKTSEAEQPPERQ